MERVNVRVKNETCPALRVIAYSFFAVTVIIIGVLGLFFKSRTNDLAYVGSTEMSSITDVRKANCPRLNEVQTEITATIDRLNKFWDIANYPNFLTTMHITELSWDIQKAKFVKLLLESNNAKEKTFVAGFSGSSVTAGHDNYFYEAYPQVFYDTMLPVFLSMKNVNFSVRNHALGNNPCYPYDACIASHLGNDLDLLSWEQSMNCGRWSKPLDTFARSAYYMDKKPTLLFIASGGPTWTSKDCNSSSNNNPAHTNNAAAKDKVTTDKSHNKNSIHRSLKSSSSSSVATTTTRGREVIPLSPKITSSRRRKLRRPLTPQEELIASRNVRMNAASSNYLRQFTFLQDTSTIPGHINYLVDRFASMAPMAQSMFACQAYQCQGPYNSSFNEKTPGGGAAHHPGRMMHKLRGESLAYFMLHILQDAVHAVQTIGSCSSSSSGSSNYNNNNNKTNSSSNSTAVSYSHTERIQRDNNKKVSSYNNSSLNAPAFKLHSANYSNVTTMRSSRAHKAASLKTNLTAVTNATTTTITNNDTSVDSIGKSIKTSNLLADSVDIVTMKTRTTANDNNSNNSTTIAKQVEASNLLADSVNIVTVKARTTANDNNNTTIAKQVEQNTNINSNNDKNITNTIAAGSDGKTKRRTTTTVTNNNNNNNIAKVAVAVDGSGGNKETVTTHHHDSISSVEDQLAYIKSILNLSIPHTHGTHNSNNGTNTFIGHDKMKTVYSTTVNKASVSTLSMEQAAYWFVSEYIHHIQHKEPHHAPSYANISEIIYQPRCYTNFEPRMSNAITEVMLPAPYSNWQLQLSFLDRIAVEKSIQRGLGYLDRKYIYLSTGLYSTLTIQVEVGSTSAITTATPIWLCECPKGFVQYPSNHTDLNLGAAVYIRYNYDYSSSSGSKNRRDMSTNLRQISTNSSSSKPNKLAFPGFESMTPLGLSSWYLQCYRTDPVPPGRHVLTIQQTTEKRINLAYVVTW